MIPPAAAPPSAPIPAPFSRVVNGVEQPAKAARKNISAKNLDFLIIVPLLFFVASPPLSSPTRTGRPAGRCAGWKKVAVALSWQRESFMTLVACVSAVCFVAYPVDLTLLNPVLRLIRNIPGSSVFSARGDVAALGTIKSDWKGMLASRTVADL
jgi:hypothetical protein